MKFGSNVTGNTQYSPDNDDSWDAGVRNARSKIQNARSTVNAVNKEVQEVTNTVQRATQMADQVAGKVQQYFPGLDISGVTGTVNSVAGSISNAAGAITSKVDGLLRSGDGILKDVQDAINLGESFKNAVSDVFGNGGLNTAALSKVESSITKGLKATDSLIEALGSSSEDAESSPVSFVTKPILESIKGTSTQTDGKKKDLTDVVDGDTVDNISKALGKVVSSASDLNNVVRDVTNELSQSKKDSHQTNSSPAYEPNKVGDSNFLSGLVDDVSETVGSWVSSSVGRVTSAIEDLNAVTDTARTMDVRETANLNNGYWRTIEDVDPVIDAVTNIDNLAAEKLNDRYKKTVPSQNKDKINVTAESIVRKQQSNINDAVERYAGTGREEVVADIMVNTDPDAYAKNPKKTDPDTPTDNPALSTESLADRYDKAQEYLPDLEKPKEDSWNEMKRHFDMDFANAISEGNFQLALRMKTADSSDPKLFDDANIAALRKNFEKRLDSSVGRFLDSDTIDRRSVAFRMIIKIAGPENISPNMASDAISYMDDMSGYGFSDEAISCSEAIIKDYDDIGIKLDVAGVSDKYTIGAHRSITRRTMSLTDITTPNFDIDIKTIPIYDAQKVTRSSLGVSSILDKQIGFANRKLIQVHFPLGSKAYPH